MSEKLKERLWLGRMEMRRQAKMLRRARHLYIWICRESIVNSDSNWTLDYVGRRMLECGMWAPGKPLADRRFAILRHCWQIEKRLGWKGPWFDWLREMGWASGNAKWERITA